MDDTVKTQVLIIVKNGDKYLSVNDLIRCLKIDSDNQSSADIKGFINDLIVRLATMDKCK